MVTEMNKTKKMKNRRFCIIHFIEPPFENIDHYVCVPNSWVIRRLLDKQAIVAYPSDIDPSQIRNCVKRKHGSEDPDLMPVYMAHIEYEFNSYKVAEHWVAHLNNSFERKNQPHLKDQESDKSIYESEIISDTNLGSNIHCPLSNINKDKPALLAINSQKPIRISIKRKAEPKYNHGGKREKLDKVFESSRISVAQASVSPGSSKRTISIITSDGMSTGKSETQKFTVSSIKEENFTENSNFQRTKEHKALAQAETSNTRQSSSYTNSREKQSSSSQKPIKMSIKLKAELKNNHGRKREKHDTVLESSRINVAQATVAPGSSKRTQSIIISDDTSTGKSETHKSAVFSINEEKFKENTNFQRTKKHKALAHSEPSNTRQSSSSTISREKQSSSSRPGSETKAKIPIIDLNEPDDAIIINQPENISERKPCSNQTPPTALEQQYLHTLIQETLKNITKNNLIQLNDPNIQKSDVYSTKQKPSISAKEFSPTNRHTRLGGKLYEDSQPRKIREERSTEAINDIEITYRHIDVPSNSHQLPCSIPLNDYINATLLSSMTEHSHNLLKSISKSGSVATHPAEGQANSVTQSYQQEVTLVPEMYGRYSMNGNNSDQIPVLQSTANSTQAFIQMQQRQDNYMNRNNCLQGISDTAAASEHVSNLTQSNQSFWTQRSDEQQHLPNNNLQQFKQLLDSFTISTGDQNTDGIISSPYPSTKRILTIQEQQDQANQPSCSHSQNKNQYITVDRERNCLEQHRRYSKSYLNYHKSHSQNIGSNYNYTIQNTCNESNQWEQDSTLRFPLGQQDSQQNPRKPKIHANKSQCQKSSRQGVIKGTQPPPVLPKLMKQPFLNTQRNYSIQSPLTQARVDKKSIAQNDIAWTDFPQNIKTEPIPIMEKFEIQNTTSPHSSHEGQYRSDHENQVYQYARALKTMIDRSTKPSLNKKHVMCQTDHENQVYQNARALNMMVDRSTQTNLDKKHVMCQTDVYLREEYRSPEPELATDHKAVTNKKTVSYYEISTAETPVEVITNDDCSAESIPLENDVSVRPTTEHPRNIIEQQILDECATLFAQMITTMSHTHNMFNGIRDSIQQIAQTYKTLLDAVDVYNESVNSADTASTSSNVISSKQ